MRLLLRYNGLKGLTGDSNCSSLRTMGFRCIVTSCRAVVFPRFSGGKGAGLIRTLMRSSFELVPVSINALDTRMRSGYGRILYQYFLPLILGRDVRGEVAAVGSSVIKLRVGQEVFGALHPTADNPPKEASAIPFAALTAWHALIPTARIMMGQRVLVVGGGGAVGFSAIQLAVNAGCRVSTICGGKSIDRLLAAGAEQAVDYTAEDLEVALKGHFDAVLDTIGVPESH